jgi:hypothetical protein
MATTSKLKICVCGAGNGAQSLIAFLSHQTDRYEVSVLASYGDEAEQLQTVVAASSGKGITVVDRSDLANVFEYSGKPCHITKNPAEVIPFADAVIVVVPGFALRSIFTEIQPHFRDVDATSDSKKEGTLVYVLPGQGSANLVAENVFKEDLHSGKIILAGVIPMPVNARIQEWGRLVDLTSFKPEYWVATVPAGESQRAADLFQNLMTDSDHARVKHDCQVQTTDIARAPVMVHPISNYLGLLLHASNPNLHPGRLYRLFKSTKDFEKHEIVRFYEDWDDESSDYMQRLSDERLAIWRALCAKLDEQKEMTGKRMCLRGKLADRPPRACEDEVPSIYNYLTAIYKGQIADTSKLTTVITTNAGFHDLKWEGPSEQGGYMRQEAAQQSKDKDIWRLDPAHPFFREDIPEGLIVYKGIAELIGFSETPFLDELLRFFQGPDVLNKDYISDDGVLRGRDVLQTKAPQAFGISNFEELIARGT